MWDLTVYPYLQFVSGFLILFSFRFTRNLLLEKRVLAYLDSRGRPWVEEAAKHLHIILPPLFQREVNLDSPERSPVCLQEGYQKVLPQLELFLQRNDKGGLGSGY